MTALRLAFALVLLALCVLLARQKTAKLALRCKALGDFLGFARHLEVLIRVNGRPIPEALRETAERFGKEWIACLSDALAGGYRGRQHATGIWASALSIAAGSCEEAAALSREDCRIITLFGDQLASSDIKAIAENYALLYTRIGENLQAADRDKAVKGRLYSTIGTLAGLAAAILVI